MSESLPKTFAKMLTAPGRGGIAVISLTGPGADDILRSIFKPISDKQNPCEGKLQLGRLVHSGEVIDEAVICRSADIIELNIHGGPATASATLKLLRDCGATIATPKADSASMLPEAHLLYNNPAIGRELAEVLPAASGELLTRALTSQWSGGISALTDDILRDRLPPEQAIARVRNAAAGLKVMQRMLRPPEIVLTGPPNAGKSTLANALTGRQVSIVHPTAGTTRDWVRERGIFSGLEVWITDTAGIWQCPAGIDAQAVERSRHRASRGDLVIMLSCDGATSTPEWLDGVKIIRAASQCDRTKNAGLADVAISAKTGTGLDKLRKLALKILGLDNLDPLEPRAFTQRQAKLLTQAANALAENNPPAAKNIIRHLLGQAQ